MRRAYAMLGMSAVVLMVTAFLATLPRDTRASSAQETFLVPASDGYGLAECLVSNRPCGQVVANSWCEAQGYAKAISYRQVGPEEMTGSVQKAAIAPKERPVAITCVK